MITSKVLQPDASSGSALTRRGAVGLIAGAALVSTASAGSAAGCRSFASVFDRSKHGKVHVVRSTPQTVKVGVMDPALPIILEIDSGDVVHYPNTWLNWANEPKYGMTFAEREPIRKRFPQGPYSMIGPISMRGAAPEDVIECRMIRLRPISWGWNSAPRGVGALPEDFQTPYLRYIRFDAERTVGEFASGIRIPLAPIQGVMALQPMGSSPVSGILAGRTGGNIVVRELVEGTSLFLPVEVPGGRIWTGDTHAAQGEGMVDQTAIESAMEDLRIQYVLHRGVSLAGPLVETPTDWIVLGFGTSLDDAIVASLHTTIDWLNRFTGLAREDAYALCSMAASFRVTQYAHQIHTNYNSVPPKGMIAKVPKTLFSAAMAELISRSLKRGS